MTNKNWDVIVVGGGIAGLVTTSLLGNLKLKVLCVESKKPALVDNDQSADLRSTAYLLKSIELLKQANVWDSLYEQAEELKIMQICDAGGKSGEIRQTSNFDSNDINHPCFGYNVQNWFVKKSLLSIIETSDFSDIIFGKKVVGLINQTSRSVIKLSDNTQFSAKLIIAADGKNSEIRHLAKIKIKKWDNTQDALAFVTSHEKPHQGRSIEILESGGPCTLVPMKASENGAFQSAVVWMENRNKAKDLLDLNSKDFSEKLTHRTKRILGKCQINSRRTIYPITTQLAERFYCKQLVLIGESAHAMPPIGAQGLNTSFEDISLLITLIKRSIAKNDDFGSLKVLKDYGTRRRLIAQSKMLGISILNITSKSDRQITKDLRKMGLSIIDQNSFLKKTLMRAGLGYI